MAVADAKAGQDEGGQGGVAEAAGRRPDSSAHLRALRREGRVVDRHVVKVDGLDQRVAQPVHLHSAEQKRLAQSRSMEHSRGRGWLEGGSSGLRSSRDPHSV